MIREYDNDECNYSDLGYKRAYEVALDTALPYLYFEIYKAEQLLEEMATDKELYKYDIPYYIHYKLGIENAIEIQKKYGRAFQTIRTKVWRLFILNLSKKDLNSLTTRFEIDGIGTCEIILCGKKEEISKMLLDNEILIIVKEKNDSDDKAFDYLNFNYNHIIIDCFKHKKINEKTISNYVKNYFKLNMGDLSLLI